MMPTLFRGSTTVRNAIASYIESSLPKFIDLARSQWSLEDWQLPYLQVLRTYERPLVSPYPSMDISVGLVDEIRLVDFDPAMAEEFTARYDIVLVTVVTTPLEENGNQSRVENDVEQEADSEYAATMRCRDDMEAAIRACLFDNMCLGQPNALQLQPETFSVIPSDGNKTGRGNLYAAAVAHRFKLRVDEYMVRDALGTADTINVDVEPLA